MVELFEQNIKTADRQSSKGNQLKWENAGVWYKADYTGYEGLSEYVISQLLKKSTLEPEEFVEYQLETIKYKSMEYKGVKCADFLEPGWQLITLERLFHNYFGQSLYKSIYSIRDYEKRILFLADQVKRITGLKDFGIYLSKLLTIDAFFLNEDRHMHNIAVLMNADGTFAYCPIFDQGAGLLADTRMDYPLDKDMFDLMKQCQAKTICEDFDEQLDLAEALYGTNLQFCFTKDDIDDVLQNANIYSIEERTRVREILLAQMRKYQYLFRK